ncbi:MAG TPA: MlaD family protein, partial [Holophaga sp.]|nr:MlaD family protein [Holophaga sp.]
MTDPSDPQATPEPASAPIVKARRHLPTVWLIPLVATLIGAWLAFSAFVNTGPTITITFLNADGLEAGHTKIKCKNVEVGVIKALRLSHDQSRVEATAELTREASEFLSANSRFWIVRARVSTSGISGLGTLLSGAYVSMDPGAPGSETRQFTGLETPPTTTSHEHGQLYT